MHRALCRVIRGTCRKFRENDCPTIAGEEVRQHRSKSKEDFTTPRHSATEALGWTAGIILTYEFAHRRSRNQNLFEDCVAVSTNRAIQGYLQKCPFAVATKAIAQPTLSTPTVSHNVRAEHERRPRSFLTSRKSIDTTPFLFEKSGNEKFLHGLKYSDRKSIDLDCDSEDEGVHFDETISQFDEVRNAKPRNVTSVALAEKLTGDLFSALGAFNFLTSSEDGTKSGSMNEVTGASLPRMSPLELLEKGAELGSSRALYNIGVAYDRMKEIKLAGEYYRRAADLGHPLATYNVAVLTLQDGKISEGLALMRFAAENGIPEARAVIDSA